MADRSPGRHRSLGTETIARWLLLALLGSALLLCGVILWHLPWTSEALVVGQVWTPQIAIAAVILALTLLAACFIRGVNALWHRFQHLSWAFELATLAVMGVVVVWLGLVGLTCLGFIPADAHFAETHVQGRTIVIRTTSTPYGTTATNGLRTGPFVRWGISTFTPR